MFTTIVSTGGIVPLLEVELDDERPGLYLVTARDTDRGVYFQTEAIDVTLTRDELRSFARAVLAATD